MTHHKDENAASQPSPSIHDVLKRVDTQIGGAIKRLGSEGSQPALTVKKMLDNLAGKMQTPEYDAEWFGDGHYCTHHPDDPAHGSSCYEHPIIKDFRADISTLLHQLRERVEGHVKHGGMGFPAPYRHLTAGDFYGCDVCGAMGECGCAKAIRYALEKFALTEIDKALGKKV